jgi:hypothetical protein
MDHDYCRECGRPLGYLMQEDHSKPGLIDSLQGAGGEAWRLFVTIGVCVIVALMMVGLWQVV